ncbi:MAG: hypothetical protein RLZZ628_2 [Bacteroidota bacterium]
MSALALQAQTTSIKKYHNGMPDTIWHIKGLDTFLIETFQLNGHLSRRAWREDSTYYYDNQGNIHKKIVFLKKKQNLPIGYQLDHWKQYIEYYPNGKIAQYAAWLNDTAFHETEYEFDGVIQRQTTIQIHPPHLFERVIQPEKSKTVVLVDTFKHIQRTWNYLNDHLRDFKAESMVKNYNYNTTQYIEYGANNKVVFEWALDSNALIPFKDNGLCLYGFTNLKLDTIISPRYENVETIHNKEIQPYYIIQHGTKYGVLDEFGNLIIPEIWSYLKHFVHLNGYSISSNQTSAEAFLENTYLECRQASGFGILNLNGQIVLEPVYQGIRNSIKKLYEVKINGAWGIVDTLGKIVVAPHYKSLKFTETSNVYLIEEEQKNLPHRCGLIRQDGTVLLPLDFQDISELDNGFFSVTSINSADNRGKTSIFHPEKGWIYKNLDEITNYKYKFLHKAGKITVVLAKTMNPILPFECDASYLTVIPALGISPRPLLDTVLSCTRAGKTGLFHLKTQSWLLPLEYEALRPLTDSIFAAKRAGIWQIINHRGQKIMNQSFTNIGSINSFENYWFVQQKDSILFLNKASYPLFLHPLDTKQDIYEAFDGGLLHCKAFDGSDVLINRKQKVLNPPHTKIQKLQNGYATAFDTLQKMQILIDSFGKIYPFLPQYEIVYMDISEGVVLVFDKKTQQLGAVQPNGRSILPCTYFGLQPLDAQKVLWAKKDKAVPVTETDYRIQKRLRADYWADDLSYLDSAWTMHSKTGVLLTQTAFDFPFKWFDSIGIGRVRGKQGLWKVSGENVVPPNYTAIHYDTTSKIFHLFETQSIDNQRVGFADAKGNLIADGLFKKMSSFSGDYAFVETAAGLGIVQKNGQYLVEPQRAGLQRSKLDLMRLEMVHPDSSEERPLHFTNSQESFILNYKNILDSLNLEKQLEINNLLLECIVSSYFLQADRIPYNRNLNRQYILDNAGDWRSLLLEMNHYRLTERDYEIHEIYKTGKYLNFWTQFTETPVHPSRYSDPIFIETLNFEWDGQIWQRITLKDILDLNPSNMGYFTHLFTQKLSRLKDEDIDCSNPSAYFDRIQTAFLVLETGIECNITESGGGFYDKEPKAIPIKFSWAELKPLLRKK